MSKRHRNGHKGSYLKFCPCSQCNMGLRGAWGDFIVTYEVRHFRRINRQRLKKFDYESVEDKISIPYTD